MINLTSESYSCLCFVTTPCYVQRNIGVAILYFYYSCSNSKGVSSELLNIALAEIHL